MDISFEDKLNDKVAVKSVKGIIVRTVQDFKLLESHLIEEANTLLIPQVMDKDYRSWANKLIQLNPDFLQNETMRNFLINTDFFLAKQDTTARKNIQRYLNKLEHIWRGTNEYHKSAN
jgi:hypothetical protein